MIEQVSSFPMLIKVGITGGIGSGKSVVSRLLEIMGIPVYISDTEAKRITCTDTVIRRELCALVGQEVFQGGELNRTLLAEYMFGYPEHVKEVNAIIHPRVKMISGNGQSVSGITDWLVWNPLSLLNPVLEKKLISL